ncbi:MAG: DNA-binding response regulator [Chloroflexi bacterium HGW-Chloroflexi-10]|nr:MAG: DNA-binding response regulator [Chloroflexi bacterium HGW-Chloroflexi-10]
MKTLIVEDDKTLADILAFVFNREGFEVIHANNGQSALKLWEQNNPDLIILDINIPFPDGFSVCETIRKKFDTPIIILTVRNDEEDIVHGLDVGADDYITKPFSPRQLMARVYAVLRRSNQELPASCRQVGNVQLDLDRQVLMVADQTPIPLTTLECRLIDCLMRNAGQVVNAEIIIDYVWGTQDGNKEMVRQLVHRLRKKVENDPTEKTIIENIPGLGYSLRIQEILQT